MPEEKSMRSFTALALTILSLSPFALCAGASTGPASAAAPVQRPEMRSPETHYQSARAALVEGDVAKAELEVKLALQDDPLDAASHFLLGCLLEQRGERDQAIVAFDRASTLDAANPETLYNLGTMLLRREEVVPASRLLENAVFLRPDHVPSYNNLAKAYFHAGLPELAVAAYEEALRRDQSNPIALKNLLLLAEAAGSHDAAAIYRRRLEALESVRAGKPVEPIALLPAWPLVAAPSTAISLPFSPVPTPQPPPDDEADALRELLVDLPHVTVERRAGWLTLTGWTSGPKEREMLGRILAGQPDVLDLTTDDSGDPQRMIEIDAVLFILAKLDEQNVGFNFLKLIDLNFNYFAADNKREGTGYSAPPDVTGAVDGLSQEGWIFSAAIAYSVNIANALSNRVAILAQPHLTALSGTSGSFLAGGELVYKVSGINSGDIKPYPFGVTLKVTPTLLRTPAADGTPRVNVKVEAGRTSVLSLLDQDPDQPTAFQKLSVTSEAVLNLGQTLILSGLSQRESHLTRSGVPLLMDIPILKYLFSTKTTVVSDSAVIILLTPRDPAFWGEQYQKTLAEFVDKRRAFLRARQGTPEDMQRFRERYPDWDQLAPSRFATHVFMMQNSDIYRAVSGQQLISDDVDLELLGPEPKEE
jgi:tetratricopeptide (TPR) repeat protein